MNVNGRAPQALPAAARGGIPLLTEADRLNLANQCLQAGNGMVAQWPRVEPLLALVETATANEPEWKRKLVLAVLNAVSVCQLTIFAAHQTAMVEKAAAEKPAGPTLVTD